MRPYKVYYTKKDFLKHSVKGFFSKDSKIHLIQNMHQFDEKLKGDVANRMVGIDVPQH